MSENEATPKRPSAKRKPGPKKAKPIAILNLGDQRKALALVRDFLVANQQRDRTAMAKLRFKLDTLFDKAMGESND